MKNFILTTILVCFLLGIHAQSLRIVRANTAVFDPETYAIIDQLPQGYLQYNAICKFLGNQDTISVVKVEGKYKPTFRGNDLPKESEDHLWETEGLRIIHNPSGQDYEFKAETVLEDGRTQHVFYLKSLSPFKDNKYGVIDRLDVHYTMEFQRIGDFKQYALNGKLRESGQYCSLDQMVYDTAVTFNADTYEETVVITEIGYEKCGEWIKYDGEGGIVAQKTYGSKK